MVSQITKLKSALWGILLATTVSVVSATSYQVWRVNTPALSKLENSDNHTQNELDKIDKKIDKIYDLLLKFNK